MADSGLFNGLRRIQIKKSYPLSARVSGCAQERLEGIYAVTFSLHSSPSRNPHLTTAAFFRRPTHDSILSGFRKGIDRKVVEPRLRFPAARGRTLGSKPNRLLRSRPLCSGFRPLSRAVQWRRCANSGRSQNSSWEGAPLCLASSPTPRMSPAGITPRSVRRQILLVLFCTWTDERWVVLRVVKLAWWLKS